MGCRQSCRLDAVGIVGTGWTVGVVGRVGEWDLFWGFVGDGSEVEGVDGEGFALGFFVLYWCRFRSQSF